MINYLEAWQRTHVLELHDQFSATFGISTICKPDIFVGRGEPDGEMLFAKMVDHSLCSCFSVIRTKTETNFW